MINVQKKELASWSEIVERYRTTVGRERSKAQELRTEGRDQEAETCEQKAQDAEKQMAWFLQEMKSTETTLKSLEPPSANGT